MNKETETKQGRHVKVSGRVQGVFFRKFTEQQAKALNLSGWVKNLPDGSVELRAFGEEQPLIAFTEKLWQGPPAAKVTAVESENIPWESWNGFTVLRD